jgi:hypothetical protein
MLEPDHPLDICYCGDYRKDHQDGTGACKFSGGWRGDGHNGAGRCDRFVFAYPYTHRKEQQKPGKTEAPSTGSGS